MTESDVLAAKAGEFDPQIVDAARNLLTSDVGLDFTVDQLAATLGISRATVYRRIGSRDLLMQHLAKTDRMVAASLSGPDMRMAVLLAARRCFARGGIGQVTMDEIAVEARVGVATVYRTFGDRQGLLRAFAEEFAPQRAIREIVGPGSGDLASDLQQIVTSLLVFAAENWDLLKLSFAQLPGDHRLFSDWQGASEQIFRQLTAYFEQQVNDGRLKGGNIQDWALALVGMILMVGVLGETLGHSQPDASPERTARRITSLFLQGIGYQQEGTDQVNDNPKNETVVKHNAGGPATANLQRLVAAGVPNVLPFSAISARDLPAVGGKGANLGEMAHAGFPVPPGFCITTRAFWYFLQESGQAEAIYAILDGVELGELESVRRAGEEVRCRLLAASMPAGIADDVRAALSQADAHLAYAVRSSATAEDLPQASFAGQQDTYLNVRGVDELLDAVHRCWVSLFTDRAITYRMQNHFDHRDVALSVVVQQMVFPEVSGILFTADPISGDRHIASIDASYGLGEALVSGLVSADLYRVDKRALREIDARIADKQLAILPVPEGGTKTEQLVEPQRSARVLTPDQAVRLAELGNRIETHYGKPQDIEWALVDDEIFVVQSRPVTSLYPLPRPRPDDDALRVYFSFSHAQVMTDPMAPLGQNVLQLLIPFGKGPDPLANNLYMATAGGRLYIDTTALLHNPIGRRILPKALTIADALSAQALLEVSQRPEFEERAPESRASTRSILDWVAPIVRGVGADLWLRKPEGRTLEVDQWSESYFDAARARLLAAEPGVQRLMAGKAILANVMGDIIREMAHNIGGGFASRRLLMKLAGDRAEPQDLDNLLRGLPGNVTTEMDLRVGDLADIVRQHPALATHLNQDDLVAALASVEEVEGGDEFRIAWNEFLDQYGMRGPSEIDISRARWNDDPTSLLQVVNGNQHQDGSGAHRLHHSAMEMEGLAAGERLVAAADFGLLGPLRARVARRMVRVSRNLMAVREHPKYLIIRIMGLVREEVQESAKTLIARGQIGSVDDIWYLTFDEINHALEDPDDRPDSLIARGRSDIARFRCMTPPRVMTSDGEIPVVKHNRDDLPAGALPGMSVSAGVVEGLAKVITDPTTEIILPGEILVAPFTDPGWTPLFINAAGLVMEVGGLMTHGSVVAREYGIPAVVGVLGATQRIATGQRIRVDGNQGYVEILSDG